MNKFELLEELEETFSLGMMDTTLILSKEGVPVALFDTQQRYALHIRETDYVDKKEYKLMCKLAAKNLSELPSHAFHLTTSANLESAFMDLLMHIMQQAGEEGM